MVLCLSWTPITAFFFLRGMPADALCVVCLGVGQMNPEGRCRYCVACRGPWYCSTTCQRYHWSTEHRDTCVGYAAANFVKQLKLPDHCAALILRFARQRDAPSAASRELRSFDSASFAASIRMRGFVIQHSQEMPA